MNENEHVHNEAPAEAVAREERARREAVDVEHAGEAATENEETIDEPVMDGATETFDPHADPRKGLDDPALIRDVDSGKKTINPYG